ncbi:MAG: hypothetical protein K2N55_09330, partial [Lachnospiraceae bacterium]|nr:hypothetical protein [Lachnospiraceae bacterium]
MRRIKTSELVPGMITAEDVYTYNNQLILPKGLILNDRTITKLAYYSIFYVKVEDSPEHAPAHIPFESTYAERLKKNPEFKKFRKDFEADVDNFKSVINDVIEKGAPLNVDELMDHTLNILDLGTTTNLFDILHNMRDYDDATYAHSMNVALICNVFARWMRMNDDEIRLATMSGLLHD